MQFIVLSAGQGTRMQPFTKITPKAMLRLGFGETVAERMTRIIKKVVPGARISYVLGFRHEEIAAVLPKDVEIILNPFYTVSNSIASLWFARHLLTQDTVIINGDIVIGESGFREVAALRNPATIVLDSGKTENLDCGVVIEENRVVLMSKSFNRGYGEYAGILQMDENVARMVKRQTEEMIESNDLNNWSEYALMQLILSDDLEVSFLDLAGHAWAELDSLHDLYLARRVQQQEFRSDTC
ncbi:MAG: NTP transferase domain-containing protein [Planctomycetota bacterium]|nr:NTP transferase domain-containing protein [Planctomycetota bacterium]